MYSVISGNKFLLLAFAWIIIWVIPWADWLVFKWLRLGVGVILFLVPGVVFSLLLAGDQFDLPFHLLVGFVISVFYVEVLGLIGRIFGLPFDYIKPIFVFTGIVEILLLQKFKAHQLRFQSAGFSITHVFILIALITFSILLNLQSRFFGDDFSYLAELTNTQQSSSLGFNDNIFGSDRLQPIRFWLAMFSVALAFISEISSLHGLWLLGHYLEPWLVVGSVLSMYYLNKHFLQSDRKAVIALIFQIVFFALLRDTQQVGNIFFNRLSEDKAFAAFVQVPILLIVMDNLRQRFNLQNIILVLSVGWGLSLTHPIILSFSLFVVVIYLLITTLLIGRDYGKFLLLMIVIVVLVLPVAPLRFIDSPTAPTTYDLNSALEFSSKKKIAFLEGTPFYGFNPERIQIRPDVDRTSLLATFLSWTYLWIVLLAFVWSIVNLRKKAIAPFMTATSLLVLVTLLPFTGWIVGKFVTARMLWRTPWLLPIGMFGLVLLEEAASFLAKKLPARFKINVGGMLINILLLSGIAIAGYFTYGVYGSRWKAYEARDEYKKNLAELVQVGKFLESNIDQPSIFIANQKTMPYLPGLSSKADVVFFRTANFTKAIIPEPISQEEIAIILSSKSSATIERRVEILRQYNIQYIFHQSGALKNFYFGYPDNFSVHQVGEYWLIEFKDTTP